MARQAIVGHFILRMTIHTPAHGHLRPGFRRRCFSLPNIPVTGLALQLAKNNMTPVGEENMIRFSIDSFPRNFFSLFLKLPDLFFLWGLRNRFFMAFEAGIQVGQSGEGLGFIEMMTGIALQPLFQVLFMVERDGLLGFRTETETDEEEE